jgi:hypothetical protein
VGYLIGRKSGVITVEEAKGFADEVEYTEV